jgi:hypothetical protein
MSAVLINAWDPRHNNVVLYRNRYSEHIIVRHPEVEIGHIRLVVEDPDVITGDVNDALVENYYRQGTIADEPDYFLKVSVRFESDRGKIVTAYTVDRPKPSEVIVWKR